MTVDRFAFAIPGDLQTPTGGYAYARRLLKEWPGQGYTGDVLELPASFPFPSEGDLAQCEALLAGAPKPFLIDALAYGAFPEELAKLVGPSCAVLVHHPLCDEQGLDDAVVAQLEQSERLALSFANQVVAASPATARALVRQFGVDENRISIAIPGTDLALKAPLSGKPPRLLTVGTVTPRKGLTILIEALEACSDLDWTCDIIGAADRDPDELSRVEAAINAAGLGERVALRGKVADIEAAYLSADLFVSPSLHEGYGMAVVEAMAHGLPVVTTTAGALAETAFCARLVEAGDAAAFADAMRPLIVSRDERVALGSRCRRFARELQGWDETARVVAQAVAAVR